MSNNIREHHPTKDAALTAQHQICFARWYQKIDINSQIFSYSTTQQTQYSFGNKSYLQCPNASYQNSSPKYAAYSSTQSYIDT